MIDKASGTKLPILVRSPSPQDRQNASGKELDKSTLQNFATDRQPPFPNAFPMLMLNLPTGEVCRTSIVANAAGELVSPICTSLTSVPFGTRSPLAARMGELLRLGGVIWSMEVNRKASSS